MNQLDIHKRIDTFFESDMKSASIEVASELININEDAKRYFFFKANEKWLPWFYKNNLFKKLKDKAQDLTKYSYRLPELEYLTRMTEKEPDVVTDIIISIPISEATFNPEVVDRFFWITGLLPATNIKIILPKILLENWPKLMALFGRSGYEYQKMVEKLVEVKDYDSLITLAEIIFTTRSKEELDTIEKFIISDKIFYLHDINHTGIFEALLNPENKEKEKTLKTILNVLSRVVTLGRDPDEKVFAEKEPFYLLDVDMFTAQLKTDRGSYKSHDIENIFALSRILIEEIFTHYSQENLDALYSDYISELPDSRSMYRLKLYTATRRPEKFKEELKKLLYRIFEVGERYFEVEGGAEYHHALVEGFSFLDEETKRDFISKIIDYFGAKLGDSDKESWRKRDGIEILSFIKNDLTTDEISKSEKLLGKLSSENISPHPDVLGGRGGIVSHRSPVKLSDYTVAEVIEHLKTDLSPSALKEQYKDDDFLAPRGPEGLGDELMIDFKNRKEDYFNNLIEFFDREKIHPSYLWFLLRVVDEMLRNKQILSDNQNKSLINLFTNIRLSGEEKEFEKSDDKSWLADWIAVNKIMADITLEILADIKDSQIFIDNKKSLFALIKYLLSVKSSPNAEDEKRESNEPSHVAINSVRGQAFRAFVQFTYNEGNNSLSKEVKDLYIEVLNNDKSNAVRFTLGQFLASFYFRDIEFIKELLPQIFPIDNAEKKKEYFATWEGYLASSLYKELFVELNKYYQYAIKLNERDYPERKYSKSLDESLAIHLSLAFAHFEFDINYPLLDFFWKTSGENRHYEFISFIGRTCITRDQAGDKWLEENGVSKTKLIDFWNWTLTTDINIEPKSFSGFGFWINPNKEIIDDKIVVKNLPLTLEKSAGDIDWDYGLTRRLKIFAEIDPENTLKIIRNYLIIDGELNSKRRAPLFSLEHEVKEALSIIYKKLDRKEDVEDLISILVEKGSKDFWDLKEVIDGKTS